LRSSARPPRLILASSSPQRRAILEQLGIAFEVRAPDVEELAQGPPHEVALENAYRKATAVAGHRTATAVGGGAAIPVLGADTVVALGSRIYGKPADRHEARATLQALSGARHLVIGGLCLLAGGRSRTATATTGVTFQAFEQGVIEWYLDTGEWRGRAGAYAVQGRGAALVKRIEGDYLNVVGLPAALLLELMPTLLAG
jgi:septum formation protein